MPTYFGLDGGYNGQIVSLAGVRGRAGLGLKMLVSSVGVGPAVTPICILSPNGARKWAIIENVGDNVAYICFADSSSNIGFWLRPYGSLQIDDSIVWCGAVFANVVLSAPTTLNVHEASVQA